MKKDVNGVILDMTPEEEAEWYASQQPEQSPPSLPEYVTYEALAQAIREGVNNVE